MTRLLLTIIIIISSVIINAQSVVINDNCKLAYTDILSLRFDDAKEKIALERRQNPDNLLVNYLDNYIDFLKVTLSEDEVYFNSIENKVDETIRLINKLDDSSRFKKYFLGNIYLQWATVNLRFQNYITGIIQLNKSYRLVSENDKDFPKFFPNKISLGVLHIMIGIVPDSYQWLLNLVSIKGTVSEGKIELEYALEQSNSNPSFNFLSNEIIFYKGMVELSLSPDPNLASYILSKIEEKANNNLLLSYLAINILMKNGENDNALKMFNRIDYKYNYFPFYYMDYLKGECYLRRLDLSNSEQSLEIFRNNFSGVNYMKDAQLKIAWCSLLNGDTAKYLSKIAAIRNIGTMDLDADKRAQEISFDKSIPNINLLKARLLFDGGYYYGADSIINLISIKDLNTLDITEFHYRSARISHALNNNEKAKLKYIQTIYLGNGLPNYYAGNSALKLGNIYEIEGDTINALTYYKLCSDMDFIEYRNSIRGKAKQGIQRLRN